LNKYPNVSIEDSTGDDVMGQISYINLNKVQLTFIVPISGTAYLS
jgi:hypothetical protein